MPGSAVTQRRAGRVTVLIDVSPFLDRSGKSVAPRPIGSIGEIGVMRTLRPLALLVSGAFALPAAANPISFQGSMALENVTSPCIDDGFNVDGYYTMTFSYANGTSGASDALAIVTPRAALRIISTAPSGTLVGPVPTYDTLITSQAGLYNYASSSNLSISTVGGKPLSAGVNVKVIGTINDAFRAGCTMTLHGLVVVRPIQ